MSLPPFLEVTPVLVAPGRYSFTTRNSPLWTTFPPGTRIDAGNDGEEGEVTVSFPAESAFSLKDLLAQHKNMLPYSEAVALFHGLAQQFKTLASMHQLFNPFYDPRGIIVINGRGCVANPGALISSVDVGTPYTGSVERMPFLPPEVHTDKPNVLTPACAIYTLAALTGASMYPNWTQHMSTAEVTNQISEIVTTPLYWCLVRCLAVKPEERVILYL